MSAEQLLDQWDNEVVGDQRWSRLLPDARAAARKNFMTILEAEPDYQEAAQANPKKAASWKVEFLNKDSEQPAAIPSPSVPPLPPRAGSIEQGKGVLDQASELFGKAVNLGVKGAGSALRGMANVAVPPRPGQEGMTQESAERAVKQAVNVPVVPLTMLGGALKGVTETKAGESFPSKAQKVLSGIGKGVAAPLGYDIDQEGKSTPIDPFAGFSKYSPGGVLAPNDPHVAFGIDALMLFLGPSAIGTAFRAAKEGALGVPRLTVSGLKAAARRMQESGNPDLIMEGMRAQDIEIPNITPDIMQAAKKIGVSRPKAEDAAAQITRMAQKVEPPAALSPILEETRASLNELGWSDTQIDKELRSPQVGADEAMRVVMHGMTPEEYLGTPSETPTEAAPPAAGEVQATEGVEAPAPAENAPPGAESARQTSPPRPRDIVASRAFKEAKARGATLEEAKLAAKQAVEQEIGVKAPPPAGKGVETPPQTTQIPIARFNLNLKLPRNLSGAKPRYRDAVPHFESDLDMALYTVAQLKKSKHDAQYMTFLKEVFPGQDEEIIRATGRAVRKELAPLYEKAVKGEFNVPDIAKNKLEAIYGKSGIQPLPQAAPPAEEAPPASAEVIQAKPTEPEIVPAEEPQAAIAAPTAFRKAKARGAKSEDAVFDALLKKHLQPPSKRPRDIVASTTFKKAEAQGATLEEANLAAKTAFKKAKAKGATFEEAMLAAKQVVEARFPSFEEAKLVAKTAFMEAKARGATLEEAMLVAKRAVKARFKPKAPTKLAKEPEIVPRGTISPIQAFVAEEPQAASILSKTEGAEHPSVLAAKLQGVGLDPERANGVVKRAMETGILEQAEGGFLRASKGSEANVKAALLTGAKSFAGGLGFTPDADLGAAFQKAQQAAEKGTSNLSRGASTLLSGMRRGFRALGEEAPGSVGGILSNAAEKLASFKNLISARSMPQAVMLERAATEAERAYQWTDFRKDVNNLTALREDAALTAPEIVKAGRKKALVDFLNNITAEHGEKAADTLMKYETMQRAIYEERKPLLSHASDAELREDYIPRLYDVPEGANFMNAAWFKQRRFNSLGEAMRSGLVPKTNFGEKLLGYDATQAATVVRRELVRDFTSTGMARKIQFGMESKIPDPSWVPYDNPKFNAYLNVTKKERVFVPKDTKELLDTFFQETKTPARWLDVAANFNIISKGLVLRLTLFHPAALGFRAFEMGMSPLSWVKGLNAVIKDPDLSTAFLSHGGVLDSPLELTKSPFEKMFGVKGPVFDQAVNLNDAILWGGIFKGFKIAGWQHAVELLMKKFPDLTMDEAMTQAARHVNDVFGSQNMERFFLGPQDKAALQQILFTPDWNLSKFRLLRRGLGAQKAWLSSLIETKGGTAGLHFGLGDPAGTLTPSNYLAFQFMNRTMLLRFGFLNALNLMTTGIIDHKPRNIWENEGDGRYSVMWARLKSGEPIYIDVDQTSRDWMRLVTELPHGDRSLITSKLSPALRLVGEAYASTKPGAPSGKFSDAVIGALTPIGIAQSERLAGRDFPPALKFLALSGTAGVRSGMSFPKLKDMMMKLHEFEAANPAVQMYMFGLSAPIMSRIREQAKLAGMEKDIESADQEAIHDLWYNGHVMGMIGTPASRFSRLVAEVGSPADPRTLEAVQKMLWDKPEAAQAALTKAGISVERQVKVLADAQTFKASLPYSSALPTYKDKPSYYDAKFTLRILQTPVKRGARSAAAIENQRKLQSANP